MSKPIKRNLAIWQNEYEQYLVSRQYQRVYCEKRGIPYSRFKTGVRLAREAGLIPAANRSQPIDRIETQSQFLAVTVNSSVLDHSFISKSADTGSSPYCEIKLNGRDGIRIETRDAMTFLVNMVRELGRP